MISCILLLAGLNQRFGSPKALALLRGKPVIQYIQKALAKSQVAEIIVVLGAYADQIKPHLVKHPKIKPTINDDYQSGQTSSFKAGLRNVSFKSSGIMLLPIDYPFIKPETFNILINHFLQHKPNILIPTYRKKKGHPPIFSIGLKPQFLSLNNALGINHIAQESSSKVTLLPVEDPAVLATFNTPSEFEALKTEFEKS